MKKVDILNFIISYVSIGIAFIITLARTRVFTVEEVGIYSYILSIASIAAVVLNFGIQRIILRYYTTNKHTDFLWKLLKLQIYIFIFILLIYNFVIKVFPFVELNYNYYIIIITFTILMIGNLDIISIVIGQSVKSNYNKTIVMQLLNIIILLGMFYFDGNIFQYLFFYILAQSLVIVFMFKIVKNDIFDIENILDISFFYQYFSYGLFVMLNAGAATIILNIDNIMVKHYLGLKAVGIYAISFTIAVVVGMVGNIFSRSVPPLISKYLATAKYKELEMLYKENTEQQIYIGLFLLIVLTVFSKQFLGLMGHEYISGYIVLILIAFGQMIHIGTGMCGTIIGLSKYYKYEAYFNLFLLIVTIITNIIFIPLLGIVGAALASLLTIVLINMMKVIFVYIKFGMQPYRLQNVKILIVSVFIFNCFIGLKEYSHPSIITIIFLSIIMFIVYDILLFIWNVDDRLSIKLFNKIKTKGKRN